MILHKKQGLGKDDNITYIMQKTNKGTKPKTDAEMQALVEELNRQNKIREINTRAVYVKDANSFNPKDGMDATDSMMVIGDGAAQVPFIRKHFGKNTFPMFNWKERTDAGEVGISKMGSDTSNGFIKGEYGVVDTHNAESTAKQSNGRITPLQMLAYAIGHEEGHTFLNKGARKDGHTLFGIMESGQDSVHNMNKGYTINDLLNPLRIGNTMVRANIIAKRQHGDPDREAVDNYEKNLYAANLAQNGDVNNPLVKEYNERQDYGSAVKPVRLMSSYDPKKGTANYNKMMSYETDYSKAHPDNPINPNVTKDAYNQYKNIERNLYGKYKYIPNFLRQENTTQIKY